MCNRYTIRNPCEIRLAHLGAPFGDFAPRYNVAPTDIVPVFAVDSETGLKTTKMRWGFVPSYDNRDKPQVVPLNAKSETVLTKPMFRDAVQHRRCVMPADGFYEWHHLNERTKVPHFFHFADDRVFFFASIYSEGTEKHPPTCALLTTDPLETVKPFHGRSPLMLNEAQALEWMRPGLISVNQLSSLVEGSRWGSDLAQHVVTARVGSTKNRLDGPKCIEPIQPEVDLFGQR